ncbi:hypothetical protein PDE_03184 [Penicillium oxalicum 114-2]|uniref:Uncharacterized protein n=1 Tax=Penicillium oxalicum (strain 114-2 / CGMCC 5302) TaxID=933388 RepID=S8AQJ8_PENO1|nr:hypothetical protein PDE_03184 [Penicillium oxalicum 114-2]
MNSNSESDNSDSEEGGMQLDISADRDLYFAEGDSDMDDLDERDGFSMEEDRDENDFTTRAINPHSSISNAHNTPSQPGHRDDLGFPPDQQDRPRPRPRRLRTKDYLTEEQHAALSVLSNWELLVTHALNNHRTIPQTRRRFQAKLLAGDNLALENELYASRFVIPASKSEFLPPVNPTSTGSRPFETASGADNSTAFLIPGSYREVIENDDSPWWPQGKPREKRKSNRRNEASLSAGSEGSSRVVSRAGSVGRGG